MESGRPLGGRLDPDRSRRRHDQIQRDVVAVGLDCSLGNDLAVVDGRGNRRRVVDAVEATQDGELQIAEPLALADAGAGGVDGDAPGDDQIDVRHLLGIDGDAVFRGARHRRRVVDVGDLLGCEAEKRLGLAEPRDGHVEGFPVAQRPPADRQLRGIGVALERVGVLPRVGVGQSVCGVAGVSDVRNPTVRRKRKPSEPRVLEMVPDPPTNRVFGHAGTRRATGKKPSVAGEWTYGAVYRL